MVPQEAAGDDHVRIVEWVVADGARIDKGTIAVLTETSKAAFEIEAPFSGYLFHLFQRGESVRIGSPIAVIAAENVRPELPTRQQAAADLGASRFTRKALEMMRQHQVPESAFSGCVVVRTSDVEAYLRSQACTARNGKRFFGDEELSADENGENVDESADLRSLQALLTRLRRKLKAKYNRHVPLGTLLHDRWDVAREYRFGEGTSVYDECLIQGDVTMGERCWVGPYTVLDGNFAALRIGNNVSIGTGAHVYTHDTIDRTLTDGQAPIHTGDTVIGDSCFIGPLAIVGPGSVLGDHCFVASGSFVSGEFPAWSYIAGAPARRVGHVEIAGGRVRLVKE
jgi:acetyltransferase-like isoleucine patch superfamily enzyme